MVAALPMFEVDLAGGYRSIAVPPWPILTSRRQRGARLAIRNVIDLTDCGIAVVNPWTETWTAPPSVLICAARH